MDALQIRALDDASVLDWLAETVEDMNALTEDELQSEWHAAVFAAMVMFSQEANRRGLSLKTLH